nr:scavenger receptor class B member 1-like [Biomphalaria glabrata]
MLDKKILIILIVGAVMAVIGITMIPLIDFIIKGQIKKNMVISNSSERYDMWKDVPVPIYLQFYIFHVDNPDEVKKGDKPVLIQKGPYTYRERRSKFNITWNDNGTVSYRQNRIYSFVPKMSPCKESDIITTLNPIVAVLTHNLKWMPSLVKKLVSYGLKETGEDLFITRTVKELLWGYDDPALLFLQSLMPSAVKSATTGYFIQKNLTDDGLYTIHTGAIDSDLVGKVSRHNGQSVLDVWSTPWANMINGTDGSVNSPLNFDREIIEIFVSDMCRSISAVYKTDVKLPQGIKLQRFEWDESIMMNASLNEDNIGYCVPQSLCLPSGLLNMTMCRKAAGGLYLPLVISFPHFLYGDPEVINSFEGLHPSEREHQTLIDVEPWTGLVLRATSKLQINMYIEQVPDIEQTRNLRSLYFPIFWLNVSSVVDDKNANLLKKQLFNSMEIADGVKYSLLSVGLCLVILAAVLYILDKYKHHDREETSHHEQEAAELCLKGQGFRKDEDLTYCDPMTEKLKLEKSHQIMSTSSKQSSIETPEEQTQLMTSEIEKGDNPNTSP